MGVFSGFSIICIFELIYFIVFYPILHRSKRSNRVSRMITFSKPRAWMKIRHRQRSTAESSFCKQIEMIRSFAVEFTSNTSMPGFRFVSDATLKWYERSAWAAVLVILFAIAIAITNNYYERWQNSPVVVTMSSKRLNTDQVRLSSIHWNFFFVFCIFEI